MAHRPELATQENLEIYGGLFTCPDCKHACSNFAEACPSCGRFFRAYQRTIEVSRNGWSITVFWGIMLAWIIPTLLTLALIVILFIIGAIGAASLTQPLNRP